MLLEAFVGAYCLAQTQTLLIRSMNGCQRTCLCAACVGTSKMRPLKVFMKQTQQTKWRLRCSWLSHREFLWHGAATILPWRPDCDALKGPVRRVLKRRLRGGPMNSVWRRFDILRYFEWIKLKMSSQWGGTGRNCFQALAIVILRSKVMPYLENTPQGWSERAHTLSGKAAGVFFVG